MNIFPGCVCLSNIWVATNYYFDLEIQQNYFLLRVAYDHMMVGFDTALV